MRKFIYITFVIFLFSVLTYAQTNTTTETKPSPTPAASTEKPKKQIFRANKDQITQVQKMLKDKGLYAGEATGKMDEPFRTSIKSYQKDNGLKQTGTLNRATLEKMGVVLTDKQKEIPVDPNSFATNDSSKSSTQPKKSPVFRASKEQIMQAQKMLKDKAMYSGEESGKLDDATREGLKKYQAANGLKVTGTLNQITLEKMGIALTDKQKENASKSSQR
jgi:peptidoglycan hydrolase-like protein with peptidoglycan-binding domain